MSHHTFHHSLAQLLVARLGEDLSRICVVFPTRRARLFFLEALNQLVPKTVWAPETYAIEDWVKRQHDANYPENLLLLNELYPVYLAEMQKRVPDFKEGFEKFMGWGEMMLKDFDEIDRYLVDAQKLYANLKDLKEIEFNIGMADEMRETIQRLMSVFNREQYSDIQQKFLSLWEVLSEVYRQFKIRLQAQKWAYEGMAYKALAEACLGGSFEPEAEKVVFVGFNALSKCEEVLMEYLLKKQQGIVVWDGIPQEKQQYDILLHDAFYFVQFYHRKWQDYDSICLETDFREGRKQIQVVGVPQQVSQAAYMGASLSGLLPTLDVRQLRQTAVLLADESLLFPVLYALPAATTSVNITLGFPLRNTNIYQLMAVLLRMVVGQKRTKAGKFSLYFAHLNEVLQNPLIQAVVKTEADAVLQELREKKAVFVPEKYWQDKQLGAVLQAVVNVPADSEGLMIYVEQVLELMLAAAENAALDWEAMYAAFLYRRFLQTKAVLQTLTGVSLKGVARIIKDAFRNLKIPFEGEPLEGLQVMGMLESRTLDFDTVYLLSMNEGTYPSARAYQSLIPNELRNYYKLPKEEDKSRIMAYHFFRLLKRANHIHLVYHADAGNKSGEQSRYILQLVQIFKQYRFPDIEIQRHILTPENTRIREPHICIRHTPEIFDKLKAKYCGEAAFHAFSVTSLTTYLKCPLQFYFRYVAELRQTREITETIDELTFGEMIHKVMERLYQPLIGKRLEEADFLGLIPQIDAVISQVFEEFGFGQEELVGKNYLYRHTIMQRVCERFIGQDAALLAEEPFTIAQIEESGFFVEYLAVESVDERVRLTGNFDRLDKLETPQNAYRIVDYKTGKVIQGSVKELSLDLEAEKTDKLEKNALQGALYTYLFKRKYPERFVKMGFYGLKKSGDTLTYFSFKAAKGESKADKTTAEVSLDFVSAKDLNRFELFLQSLIRNIYYSDFPQTQEEKICAYCDFNRICNRKQKD